MSSNALKRSGTDVWFGGVCGGLAEKIGWSANRVRFAYVVASVLSVAFPGILVYVILWIVMPPPDSERS